MPSQTTLTLLHKEAKKRVFLQDKVRLYQKSKEQRCFVPALRPSHKKVRATLVMCRVFVVCVLSSFQFREFTRKIIQSEGFFFKITFLLIIDEIVLLFSDMIM